jgi:TonB family protein
LVELPPRSYTFFRNLRDLIFSERLPPLELRSEPAEFWPDVFVARPLPWSRFAQSAAYHAVAGTALIALAHLLALQPRVVPEAWFDHSQVIYYQASEYLPPLDTRPKSAAQPTKADPDFSPQPIISVPAEADNRSQTIITPPKIRLKHDVAMPNVVAWSDAAQKPRLAIPEAPLVPAAEIRRLAPTVENSVVTPPPDAARMDHRRNSPALQTSVVAPPPDLRASATPAAVQGLQPALIAPPPELADAATRRLGDMTIGPSNVIAPAPQLPVAAQRTAPGGSLAAAGAPQVVPPPPALSAAAGGSPAGSPGRLLALSLHPAVAAPPDPPAGNRRGSFAATPEGHSGASGSPGAASGSASTTAASGGNGGNKNGGSNGGSSTRKANGDLPSGLYVGSPAVAPAAVAGNPAGKEPANSVNPNLIANVRPPRVTTARPMEPESATKLSEPEREVFGNRKFYSVSLNMPNLNSGGGSWVIRFAELKKDSGPPTPDAPAADLTRPMATRKVDPAYPLQLMRQNVSGTVILYAVIRADGTVGNVRVLRGVDDRLDRFASEAVAQWKFDPATKDGTPVDVEATFQIPFKPTRFGTSF